MKKNWLERSVDSVVEVAIEIRDLFKKLETWAVLALLAVFATLIYFGLEFALRTDSMLHFLGYRGAFCREPGDTGILVLFCGALFFALATVVMFGEIAQYLDLRRRSAARETRKALIGALCWGGFAFVLGTGLMLFLKSLC